MKCKDCSCCHKGWFDYRPNDYVCTGVKEPFVISDIENECTEYKWTEIKQPVYHKNEPYVDDDGIYVPADKYYSMDDNYIKIMCKEAFVEAYKRWVVTSGKTTAETDNTPLPCPFCGGKPVIESWGLSAYEKMFIDADYWWAVFCDDCLSEGANMLSKEEAITAWNRRV